MDIKEEGQNWSVSLPEGGDKALSYFFKLHAKSLGYFATRLVADPLEAEDIVADCFVKLWERRHDFQTEENIKAFLYISCRNACLDYLRRLKVKSIAQQAYFSQLEEAEETILYQIITTEVIGILHQEIAYLPDNYREVFQLIYFDQMKTDQIAARLGLSVQTVRNYKSRAVDLLKTSMLKKGVSPVIFLAFLLFLDRR